MRDIAEKIEALIHQWECLKSIDDADNDDGDETRKWPDVVIIDLKKLLKEVKKDENKRQIRKNRR